MTHNKYSTQANNKYNDIFINKFEKPSNIIQKRLQKATTVTNDENQANKTGYANLVNEYKKLGITTMPDFNTYDVNDPNYMDKYDPQKALAAQNQALAGQKRDKIWGSLTPAQQYAYTTLASSAKSLGMDVPAIESVDLSNPFWLAKTLNDVNEKISYTNFKGAFDANKAYAFDQFKQEKMYYDDRTRMYDAATWQKMWDDSAQSKLWSDDSFNSQWNTKLTIDRMGNGLWDLGQWGNQGRGGGGGPRGGGGPEGGGPEGNGPENPPRKFTAADLDTYLRENNIQFSSDPESAYQQTVRDFWTAYGPDMGRTNVRKPSYITAQGNRNPIDFTQNNQTVSSGGGPAKINQDQQFLVDEYRKELIIQYGNNSDEVKVYDSMNPTQKWKYVKKEGYKNADTITEGFSPIISTDQYGNRYGGSAYTNQAILNWQKKQTAGLTGLTSQGINPSTVPVFKTITEALAAGMSPGNIAQMFGVYPSGSGRTSLDLNQSGGSKYDLIPTITPIPVKTTTPFPVTTTTPQPAQDSGGGIRPITTTTPQPAQDSGGGIKRITNNGTTIQPTLGAGGGIKPISTQTTKRMEGSFRMSNTKKFMGGKTGRMGPLINDGVGEKGRYFEKGNTYKSQSRNAIKFYETDKTDNVPMSKSFMKALARKIHEINNENYYGNEKPKRRDSIRKDGNFGSSVNLGGTINNYVSPNQRIPSKQMYELDTPRQKTPTPMGASAMKKPMGGSLNAFNPYPRSGSMATGMGAPTMKRMTTQKTITRLSQKSLPQGMPKPPQKVSSKYR